MASPLTLDSAVEIRELSGPVQSLFCGSALKCPPSFLLVDVSREAIPASSGQAREKPQRSTEPIAVLDLDLDNCKEINDRYGHAEGRRLLKTFGEAAVGFLRRSDCLARVGADEFLGLL
jgi:GGDEF domain-containing protein